MRLPIGVKFCFAALPLLMAFSCDPLKIDSAAQRIQEAIDELARQSAQWQATLKRLEQDLIQAGQSTIAVEVDQVIQRGISTASGELKCDADFIGHRMQEDLTSLKERLERRIPKPRRQYFCNVVPTSILLALAPERRGSLDFYGYNLDSGRVIVSVLESSGNRRIVPNTPQYVATPTHYLMTVNISDGNGIHLHPTDQQIIFTLNPGLGTEEVHQVNIIAPPHVPQFTFVGSSSEVAGGGGFTQGPHFRNCPPGSVGTGIQGRTGQFVDRIQFMCSPLNPDGTLEPAASLDPEGGDGGDHPYKQLCSEGELLVGFFGRSSANVESIGSHCKSPASVVAQTGPVTDLGPAPGAARATFDASCPPRSVVTGLKLWSGGDPFVVSRLDFVCSTIQLQ